MKGLLTAIVLTVLLTLCASAEVYSGRSGKTSEWSLNTETGELAITGSGALNNFNAPYVVETQIGFGDNSTWSVQYIGGEESPKKIYSRRIGNDMSSTWVLEYAGYNCVERKIGNDNSATWVLEYTDFYSYEIKIGYGYNSTWYLVQGLAPWIPYEYDTVKISEGITKIDENSAFYCSKFDVDENNPNYVSVDGVLFSKDMKELIRFPVNSDVYTYTVPSGVESINYFAFRDAENLEEIIIPDTVTYIGDFAFAGCTNLQYIKLPSKLREIKFNTFKGCTSLYSLTIPKYVTKIAEDAFIDYNIDDEPWSINLEVCENSYAESYAIMNNLWYSCYYDESDEMYIVESLSVMDNAFNTVSYIPSSSFIAEVTVTNLCSSSKDYILIACYDSNNRLVDIDFIYASTMAGQTVSLGTHIKNESGNIAKVQAFVLSDLKSFKILAESKTITKA